MNTHHLTLNIGGLIVPQTIIGQQVIRPGLTVFLDAEGKWLAEIPTAIIIEHVKA
jgi:hypothetical protein